MKLPEPTADQQAYLDEIANASEPDLATVIGGPDEPIVPRVVLRRVEDLVPYERNARTHSAEQVEQLVRLIDEFGWTNPILADDRIRAGHGRRLAALALYERGGTIKLPDGRALPRGTVPVIDCTGWSEAQKRAYVIADNQSAAQSAWDDQILRFELGDLRDQGFDLRLTAFDDVQLKAFDLDGTQAADAQAQAKQMLAERFGIPPFSILNAREGWWQNRKRAWIALGIQSEVGRGQMAATGGSPTPGGGTDAA